jgi:Protein of unknown function (DUF1579)
VRILLTTLCLILTASVRAEEPKSSKLPSREELLAMMKPGPEHETMAKYAGRWNVELKMGAGANAAKFAGAAEAITLVGKRFLQVSYATKGAGGSSDGVLTLGFDRRHGEHTIIAMDDMGTYSVQSRGKADAKTGKIRMRGTDDDPVMKAMGYTKEFVHQLEWKSDDAFSIEVFFVDTRTPERKELKAMEYAFMRKK